MQDVIRFLPNGVRKETDHICGGPGGRLPHRAGSRGGSPCRRRPHHRLFAQGSAGWGGPLPQGAIPFPLGSSRSAWRPLRRVPHPGCGWPQGVRCPIPQGKGGSAIPDVVAVGKNRYIIPGSFNRKAEGGRRPSAARCGWRTRRSEPPQGRPKGFRFVRDGATLFVESLFGRGALYHAASLASRADVRCEKDPRFAHGMFG